MASLPLVNHTQGVVAQRWLRHTQPTRAHENQQQEPVEEESRGESSSQMDEASVSGKKLLAALFGVTTSTPYLDRVRAVLLSSPSRMSKRCTLLCFAQKYWG